MSILKEVKKELIKLNKTININESRFYSSKVYKEEKVISRDGSTYITLSLFRQGVKNIGIQEVRYSITQMTQIRLLFTNDECIYDHNRTHLNIYITAYFHKDKEPSFNISIASRDENHERITNIWSSDCSDLSLLDSVVILAKDYFLKSDMRSYCAINISSKVREFMDNFDYGKRGLDGDYSVSYFGK